MLRSIIAVVASYITMVILIMVAFTALWFGLGPNALLEPGSFKGNWTISIAAPAITLIAGLVGGWMCAKIARAPKPVIVLAAIVLGLGLLMAYFTIQKPYPADPRDPAMTVAQIMEVGREPTWIALFNPIAGAATVLLGGLLLTKRPVPLTAPR